MTRKLTPAQLDEIEATAKKAGDEVSWAVETRGIEVRVPQVVSYQGLLDPDDAAHIAMMNPTTTLALVAEVRELRAKVERVRLLHQPAETVDDDGATFDPTPCTCGHWDYTQCPDRRALGKEA